MGVNGRIEKQLACPTEKRFQFELQNISIGNAFHRFGIAIQTDSDNEFGLLSNGSQFNGNSLLVKTSQHLNRDMVALATVSLLSH